MHQLFKLWRSTNQKSGGCRSQILNQLPSCLVSHLYFDLWILIFDFLLYYDLNMAEVVLFVKIYDHVL